MSAKAETMAERPFIISRTFSAPRDVMWKAWTEPERFKRWFGPKGSTVSDARMEVKVGGTAHCCIHAPDDREMWGRFIYQKIARPERLVYIQHFSNREGGITRHPMVPTWPLQMQTTVTFAEQKRKTTLTVRWLPLDSIDEECITFDSAHESMNLGWGGSFEQLADYLAHA